MFSGIVETTAQVLETRPGSDTLVVVLERPKSFDGLRSGDSICVDGVCLTLEVFDEARMQFSLGPETLKITGWTATSVQQRVVNLERSLRLSDRIHGHLVTGHVDTVGKVVEMQHLGETMTLKIQFENAFSPYVWSKGSVAINGVSLTINQTESSGPTFAVGLIPETLKRTNLGRLAEGDRVNVEVDNMARGLVHWARSGQKDAEAR